MFNKKNIKRLTALPLLLLADGWLYAADKVVDPNHLANYLGKILVICGLGLAFLVVLYIFRVFNILINVEEKRLLKEQGVDVATESAVAKGPSLWQKLNRWATDAVPVEKETDVLLDHNYDGIKELDNSLPPWWLAMFYISIIFAVIYFPYYHVFDKGQLSADEYAEEMAIAEKQQRLRLAMQANAVDENTVKALTSADDLAAGQKIFIANCAACHGQLGEGGVGPNMTDDYWIHGGDIKSIFKTIKYGVPEKGMIAWKAQMGPSSMHQVASFILTLVGTDPPNPKAPEGELYTPGEETKNSEATSQLVE